MIALPDLLTFMAVVLGLFLVPGPAVLLVATRTAQSGRRTGIATGMGIAAGDLLHTLAAAVGLSALLATSALAFTIVKLAGAAYLVYLGVRAIVAKAGAAQAQAPSLSSPGPRSGKRSRRSCSTQRPRCFSSPSCHSSFTPGAPRRLRSSSVSASRLPP